MSNIDKAALAIADTIETEVGNVALHLDLGHMTDAIAQDLADENLLMPDLPEPTDSGWVVETPLIRKVTLGVGAKVALLPQGLKFHETHITSTEARRLALALLAAAKHAEEQA